YKANMTDILASLGLVELRRYEIETIPRRKRIFEQYIAFFKEKEWAEIPEFKNVAKESSYHLFMLRIKNINEDQRDVIINEITKNGVSVNVHFQPLPLLTQYKNLGYKIEDYPVAFENYSREISLPVYFDLSDEQVRTVAETVIAAVEKTIKA